MVKEGENRGNTFREGWGTFPPPQNAGFGGDLGGAAAGGDPGHALVGVDRGKERECGEKRPARAQDIGLVAPARMVRQVCRASACGATGRATSSPTRRSAGEGRQRGHPVRHMHWSDQTGYSLQIKINTG